MSERYNAAEVEPRWQKVWEEGDVYRADDNSDKPKFYALEMFPYPSGRTYGPCAKLRHGRCGGAL